MTSKIESVALYPGSFDPPTKGHEWVISEMAEQFDRGHVAIGYNPDKVGRFPIKDREEMLGEITSKFSNISVSKFLGMYQADFAEMIGANTIIRGSRNPSDFATEADMLQINRELNPNLRTIQIVPTKDLLQVSSSVVMGLVGYEGWREQVSTMVPEGVFRRLDAQQKEKDRVSLESKWLSLVARLNPQNESFSAHEVFENFANKYNEPHRAYHTLEHIKMCLSEFDQAKHLAKNPELVELAIWTHDLIYNSNLTSTHDDESDSADFAENLVKEMILPDIKPWAVGELIMTTKHANIPDNPDSKLLCDIDLAILGRSSRLFDIYELNIRKEYSQVPEAIFKSKRKEILEGFLNKEKRESIYSTDYFKDRYETQARINLARSIRQLS